MITKDNMKEVLEFNKISTYIINDTCITLEGLKIYLNNPKLIAHIELHYGKLKEPPAFDFGKCLEDARFSKNDTQDWKIHYFSNGIHVYHYLNVEKWGVTGKDIQPIPETARILIDAANKLGELK